MAASFDPGVVEDCARLAAAEAASGGVNWTFSPMIVDNAVRRVLMLKAGLGLFDQPYVPEDEEITEPTPRARALVRAAAARSTVLLKNDGTLPVTPSGRVLLTGPYATSTDHLGAWTQGFAPRPIPVVNSRHADRCARLGPSCGP